MPSFDNLLIVVAVAFAAPLVLGFFPSVKLAIPRVAPPHARRRDYPGSGWGKPAGRAG